MSAGEVTRGGKGDDFRFLAGVAIKWWLIGGLWPGGLDSHPLMKGIVT